MTDDWSDAEDQDAVYHWWIIGVLVFVVGLFIWAVAAMDPDPSVREAPTDSIESTSTSITSPPTIAVIEQAATAVAVAVPVVERTTTTVPGPPDPCTLTQYVNELVYRRDDPTSARINYRITAACLGWTQATIELYEAGVIDDILPKESVYCPGLQRGQAAAVEDCAISGKICASCSDTGFFQITRDGWGPSGLLCRNGFYCSAESIKATPTDSMRAGLLLMMLNPSRPGQPWNYSDKSCEYHWVVCSTWPKHPWENLP